MSVTEEMTSYERVFASIRSNDFDRYPVICPTSVANRESMERVNAFFPYSHTDPVKMANLASTAHDLLGFDSVMPYFSVHIESSALGCRVDWGSAGQMPFIKKRVLSHPESLKIPTTFLNSPEIQAVLKAIKLLKKKYRSSVPVIGKVIGPWTLAYNLYGAENLTLDTINEPERTRQLIETLTSISLDFSMAQFEAGADILTWADHVTSDLISPQIYADFALPMQKIAAEKIQRNGPVILHICGNVMDRLEEIRQSGFRIFHIDSRNNISEAASFFRNKVKLCGAINNPVTLLTGSESDISREVLCNIKEGISLLSPECAIPGHMKSFSLKTIVNTAKKYKSFR